MDQTIHLCYCQIPQSGLERLARLRYVDGFSTDVLMQRARDAKEREHIAVIPLLDVDISAIKTLISHDEPLLIQHLLDCRDHVLYLLKEAGVFVPEH